MIAIANSKADTRNTKGWTGDLLCVKPEGPKYNPRLKADAKGTITVASKESDGQTYYETTVYFESLRLFSDYGSKLGSEIKSIAATTQEIEDGADIYRVNLDISHQNQIISTFKVDLSSPYRKGYSSVTTKKGNKYSSFCYVREN